MKVLVIGNGGREHALAWKIGQSRRVDRVFVAPGNAGTAHRRRERRHSRRPTSRGSSRSPRQTKSTSPSSAPKHRSTAGIVDAFRRRRPANLRPHQSGRRARSQQGLLQRTCSATPTCRPPSTASSTTPTRPRPISPTATTRPSSSKPTASPPAKASSFATIATRRSTAVDRIASKKEFGDAGNQIVIEERLHGHEASVLALTDGQTLLTLPACQDHKAACDGDTGPNTGGMGAYSPTPLVTDEMLATHRGAHPRSHDPSNEALAPPVSRRPLRRPDGHQPRHQSPRIQRPLRRPRMPAAADAAQERLGRSARSDRRRPPRRSRRARMGSAAGRLRRHGQPKAIPASTNAANRSAASTKPPNCPT